MTQLPRLLNADFTERARVRPTAYSPTLQRRATSTAKLSLPQDVPVAMHDWFELFTPAGSAGLFRVTDIDDTVPTEIQYTLLHGIDTLSDSAWKAQTDYSGTCAGFLAALLAQQTAPLWQLGECDAAFAYKRSGINYDYLNDLLAEFMEDPRLNDYYLTYDFSTTPWTLNLKAAPEGVRAEFRLSRNVERCQVRRSDADLCTRLYLSVNTATTSGGVTTNSVVIRTYNNAAAQALYGVIEKTADIDTADVPDPDAWAADFMARRAHPAVQIQIDGLRLKDLTGLDWDEYTLAALTRVALPAIAETLEERVESLSWPDPLRDARRVTVSLANRLPKFSDTIASLAKKTARAGAAARGAARGGASGKELKEWAVRVTDAEKTLDDTGIKEIHESGIELKPGTARIYSLTQGLNSLSGDVIVNSDKVSLVVDGSYGEYNVRAASIVAAINAAGSEVAITADHVSLTGGQTVQTIAGKFIVDESGDVHVTDGSKLYMGTGQSSLAVYTNDNLSAGIIVDKINNGSVSISGAKINLSASSEFNSKVSAGDIASTINQTAQSVLIQASKINLEGYVTASELSATNAQITNLINGTTQATVLSTQMLMVDGSIAQWCDVVKTGYTNTTAIKFLGNDNLNLAHYHAITAVEGTGANAGKIQITLGAVQSTEGSANFNIADTQFYKDGVSAAASGMGVVVDGAQIKAAASATKAYTVGAALLSQYISASHSYLVTGYAGVGAVSNTNYMAAADPIMIGSEAYADGYNAGEAAGAAAVTITGATRTAGPTFSSTYKTAYIDVTSLASNGATGVTQDMAIDVSDAYDAGEASVTVDSIARRANDLRSGTNILVYPRATASNGETLDETFTVDASAVYTAGQDSMGVTFSNSTGRFSVGVTSTKSQTLAISNTLAYDSTAHTYTATAYAGVGNLSSSNYMKRAVATTGTAAYDAGVTAGAAGVSISTISHDGTLNWTNDNKTLTIPITATASNGATSTEDIVLNVTQSYNLGWWNGVATGASNNGGSYTNNYRNYNLTVKVTSRDGTTQNFTVSVDTSKAYSEGWTKGFQDGVEA